MNYITIFDNMIERQCGEIGGIENGIKGFRNLSNGGGKRNDY